MTLLDCAIDKKCCTVDGGRGICPLFSGGAQVELTDALLLYINENANHYTQLSQSSCYRFTFLCLSFGNLMQSN